MKKGLFILLFIFVLVLSSCNHPGGKIDEEKTPTPTVPVTPTDFTDDETSTIEITNLIVSGVKVSFDYKMTGVAHYYVKIVYNDEAYVTQLLDINKTHFEVDDLNPNSRQKVTVVKGEEVCFTQTIRTSEKDEVAPTVTVSLPCYILDSEDLFEQLKLKVAAYDEVSGTVILNESMFKLPTLNGLGVYKVEYAINDLAGNTVKGEFDITLVSSIIMPEIESEDVYYYYESISSIKPLTTYFKAYDFNGDEIEIKDENLSLKLSDIKEGMNEIICTVKDKELKQTKLSIFIEIGATGERTDITSDIYGSYFGNLPRTGKPKILVIPVAFKNYNSNEAMRKKIEKGFFGTSYETGFESVSSYYKKSSYGKVEIEGTVAEWFEPEYESSFYAELGVCSGNTRIIKEFFNANDEKYDFSEYDSNGDGFIDGIYLIANSPLNKSSGYYWSYTTSVWNVRYYDDVRPDYFVFSAYASLNDAIDGTDQTIYANAETWIHETGHMFGLDDYYDYSPGDGYCEGGYMKADMMHQATGDHNPYSKMILGWVDPILVKEDGVFDLPRFSDSGCFLMINANDEIPSINGEYFLIDFYAFCGLNETIGIRHFQTYKSYAGVRITLINNTSLGFEGYKPIQILEKDYDGVRQHIYNTETATLSDFYVKGDKFGVGNYENYQTESGPIPFTMEVLDINEVSAKVSITFKK